MYIHTQLNQYEYKSRPNHVHPPHKYLNNILLILCMEQCWPGNQTNSALTTPTPTHSPTRCAWMWLTIQCLPGCRLSSSCSLSPSFFSSSHRDGSCWAEEGHCHASQRTQGTWWCGQILDYTPKKVWGRDRRIKSISFRLKLAYTHTVK
jgi:hypothetical protein